MSKEKTLFIDVKNMERDGNEVWFKGSFPGLTKEITKGNRLAGIVLSAGKIGFRFSDEPEVAESPIVEVKVPEKEPQKAPEGLVEGQEIREGGETYVVRLIKCLKSADEVIPLIKGKVSQSEDAIRKAVFIAGMNNLMEDLNKEFEKADRKGNLFTRLFK